MLPESVIYALFGLLIGYLSYAYVEGVVQLLGIVVACILLVIAALIALGRKPAA